VIEIKNLNYLEINRRSQRRGKI